MSLTDLLRRDRAKDPTDTEARLLALGAQIEGLIAENGALKIANEALTGENARSELRYDKLLQSYQSLKLAGAVETAPTPAREEAKQDPLIQAVMTATQGKPASVRARALKQLALDRKDPRFDEALLLASIEQGVEADGVPG